MVFHRGHIIGDILFFRRLALHCCHQTTYKSQQPLRACYSAVSRGWSSLSRLVEVHVTDLQRWRKVGELEHQLSCCCLNGTLKGGRAYGMGKGGGAYKR